MRIHTTLVTAVLIAVSARVARAQQGVAWSRQDRSFVFTDENDALGGKSDSSYTQGLRAAWEFAVWNPHWNTTVRDMSFIPVLEWLSGEKLKNVVRPCTPDLPNSMLPCGSATVTLGQTEYTPPVLITKALQPNTRPYVGYLFGGFKRTVAYASGSVSSEIQVGITGPLSLGQDTQSLAHWSWSQGSPQPQGWDNQLKTMIHASLINQYALRLFEFCSGQYKCDGKYSEERWFDVTPRMETIVGTLMDRASLGETIRVGYGFPAITGPDRIPATKAWGGKSGAVEPWIYAFYTYDQRFVAYNALITGSVMDKDDWQKLSTISTDHAFGESAVGLAAGFRQFSLSYQKVTRGSEYLPSGGPHVFGSLTLMFHAAAYAGQ